MTDKKPKKTADKKVAAETKRPATEYDKTKPYPIAEAIELTKKLAKTKFDASIEVHFKLGIDIKKGEQQVSVCLGFKIGFAEIL